MKKNILFIAHDTSLFGANQSLINMISSIKDEVEVKVVFPDMGPISEQFDDLGIEYLVVKYKNEALDPGKGFKTWFLNFLRVINKAVVNTLALKELKKIVKLHNITIIHSNSSVVGIGEELAKRENIRHVWHLREYIDLDHGMEVFGGIERLKSRIKASDKVICISGGISKHFGVQDNSIILYNSVRKTANSFLHKRKSNYFLFCGSLVKSKGIEEAILAFYKIYQGNNSLRFLIAGSGESKYESYLKKFVDDLNIQDNVDFLGFRKDTDSLMSNALGLLMCSKNEALGRVTIEAMLNSCIVIGYNNAGTAEIIKNLHTGLLYNNIDELIDYMQKIVNGKEAEAFEQIRLNAYNYACNNFLEKQFAVNLIKYYNSFNQ